MRLQPFGRYILVKEIAKGGMAEIYLAKTVSVAGVSQFVVVKRILPQFCSNKNFVAMFKHEGAITSHLKHVNMAHIYEFGVYNNSYYIAMEYVSGFSLKDLIVKLREKKMKFPVPCALHIVRSIASVLHYTYNSENPETGMPLKAIHRDVSPHNIMIGYNGSIKLIDFGISKTEDSDLTQSGVVKGKFSYMSPEQTKGEKLDHRTDIFSLGCVLWELLAGKKLFTGVNGPAIIEKIRKCYVPKISDIRSDIPSGLSDLLQLSLAKNRNARYQNAEEIEEKLNTLLNEHSPQFSNTYFKTFISKLYKQSILQEREMLMQISQKIKSYKDDQGLISRSNQHWASSLSKKSSNQMAELDTNANHLSIKSRKEKQKNSKDNMQKLGQKLQNQSQETKISDKAPISHLSTQVGNVTAPPRPSVPPESSKTSVTTSDSDRHSSWTPLNAAASSSYYSTISKKYKTSYKKKWKHLTNTVVMLCIVSGVIYAGLQMVTVPSKETTKELQGLEFKNISKSIPLAMGKFFHSTQQKPTKKPKVKRMLSSTKPVDQKPQATRHTHHTPTMNANQFRVHIITSPAGSDIYINGNKWKKRSPTTIVLSEKRKNVVQIIKSGHQPHIVNISKPTRMMEIKLKRIKKRDVTSY